jgi:hypothetical protein
MSIVESLSRGDADVFYIQHTHSSRLTPKD